MKWDKEKAEQWEREIEADRGTFLEGAIEGNWDSEAFAKLTRLMRDACAAHERDAVLDRRLALWFYRLDRHLERYLSPSLGLSDVFLDGLKEHMTLIASWFFSGVCPFEDPTKFEGELKEVLRWAPK